MKEDVVIEVLARIENEREAYAEGRKGAVGFDMGVWRQTFYVGLTCKTVACLAGHAILSDDTYEFSNTDDHVRRVQDGHVEYIEDAGAKVLGLTNEEAADVFYLDELDEVYRWFAKRMGVDLFVLHEKVEAHRTE